MKSFNGGEGYTPAAVTPNDSEDLAVEAKALYVGGAGDISIITPGGDTVLIESIPAGSVLPIRAARVRSTDTDATEILALS